MCEALRILDAHRAHAVAALKDAQADGRPLPV